MPTAMRNDFDLMPQPEKINFMVSGFKVKYTNEWKNLYENVANGLYGLYELRANMMANTSQC